MKVYILISSILFTPALSSCTLLGFASDVDICRKSDEPCDYELMDLGYEIDKKVVNTILDGLNGDRGISEPTHFSQETCESNETKVCSGPDDLEDCFCRSESKSQE